MKALLRKDFYLLKAYCKSYLLICAVFLGVSLAGEANLFFFTYPAMLCGLIPVTLQTYDERSKWTTYSACLPWTRSQLVSAKYLIGLLCSSVILALLGLVLLFLRRYSPEMRLFLWETTLCLSLLAPTLCLPFVFRLGAEKGRMAYYIAIGLFFALSYCLIDASGLPLADTWTGEPTHLPAIGAAACLVCAALYAVSWYLSVRFYQKKAL